MITTVRTTTGKPVRLQGYAQDFEEPIARLCFSCDDGATWTSYETAGADPTRNVNWSFEFTPPKTGTYELIICAECADGRTTPQPARVRIVAAQTLR